MDNTEIKPNESRFKLLSKIKLSETLVLAIFPTTAYLLIFTYYSGYFGVYKLPIQFIRFDLISIFLVSGILLGFAFIIYYWGDMIFHVFQHFPKPIRERLERFSIATFLFIVFFYLYNDKRYGDWRDWLLFGMGILILGLLEFGSPILLFTNKKAYLEKLEATDKRKELIRERQRRDNEWESPLDRLLSIVPEAFLFGLLLITVYTAGRYEAIQKTEFQIVNTNPERVVLWSTNDYALCAPFDRQTNEVEQSYIVLKIGDDPQIEYRLEKLGKLKLKMLSPSQANLQTLSPTLSISTVTPSPSSTETPTLTITPALSTPSITPTQKVIQATSSPPSTP